MAIFNVSSQLQHLANWVVGWVVSGWCLGLVTGLSDRLKWFKPYDGSTVRSIQLPHLIHLTLCMDMHRTTLVYIYRERESVLAWR